MSRKLQLVHRVDVVISYLRSLLELYPNQTKQQYCGNVDCSTPRHRNHRKAEC
jgi:hypothetical protein